jgi:hypothetical protein
MLYMYDRVRETHINSIEIIPDWDVNIELNDYASFLFRLKHSYAEKQCCAKTSHMSLG